MNGATERKSVLIVDDQEINREVLRGILCDTYDVIDAENGIEALNLLKEKDNDFFSAIILDLIMPEMDGYEFLKEKNKISEFSELPVIVSSVQSDNFSEQKGFELGAWDFIAKPYDNIILKYRLKNAILRSRLGMLEKVKFMADYDHLTGLCNRAVFCIETEKMIKSDPDTTYALFRFDIKRFKLVNSFYGPEEGDRLLKFIARGIKNFCGEFPKATCGRIVSDVFVFCIPYNGEKTIRFTIKYAEDDLKHFKSEFYIVPTYGIFVIENRSMSVDIMIDHAAIAAKTVDGQFEMNYAFYADEMEKNISAEQNIVNEMSRALKNNEFKVYFQPKYNLKTMVPEGAEALVRWKHPSNGIIPPCEFIPIFEKNGFVSRLDFYVWDKVCMYIRKWLDSGAEVKPISVNISRVDFYNLLLSDKLLKLVQHYNIPPKLLQLEITESIFTKDISVLNGIIDKFHKNGFTVMIDDFGSGYSSLNILKDIDVDILKIDMKFLSDLKTSKKSYEILKFVIQMAKNIGISTISEGVENKEQAKLLQSIGCDFAQGYLYASPMPCDEYEEKFIYG